MGSCVKPPRDLPGGSSLSSVGFDWCVVNALAKGRPTLTVQFRTSAKFRYAKDHDKTQVAEKNLRIGFQRLAEGLSKPAVSRRASTAAWRENHGRIGGCPRVKRPADPHLDSRDDARGLSPCQPQSRIWNGSQKPTTKVLSFIYMIYMPSPKGLNCRYQGRQDAGFVLTFHKKSYQRRSEA
jgi:hypothetical protein